MKRYIGTKIIMAEPTPPSVVNGDREGYDVVYEDGYKSWSPKEVFEKAYFRTDGMNFGLAVEAMRLGEKVRRAEWAGRDEYEYKYLVYRHTGEREQRTVYEFVFKIYEYRKWEGASIEDIFALDWEIVKEDK